MSCGEPSCWEWAAESYPLLYDNTLLEPYLFYDEWAARAVLLGMSCGELSLIIWEWAARTISFLWWMSCGEPSFWEWAAESRPLLYENELLESSLFYDEWAAESRLVRIELRRAVPYYENELLEPYLFYEEWATRTVLLEMSCGEPSLLSLCLRMCC